MSLPPSDEKGAGYRTAMAGKWHLGQTDGHLPTDRGFDEYLGVPYSVDMGNSAWDWGLNASAYPYGPPLPLLRCSAGRSCFGNAPKSVIEQPADLETLTARYARFAGDFIAEAAQGDAPFFFYMAFSHVHVPNFAARGRCGQSRRGLFGDAVQEMDAAVGDIIAALADSGAERDTVVWFTSDNGPWLSQSLQGGSAGLLRDGKQTTWEGGVRVPGVVSWPGVITPGIVSQEVATSYDIFPTTLAMASVDPPEGVYLDGRDVTPLLVDAEARSPHECLFIYKGTPGALCPEAHPGCPGLWAMRCGAYKLHWVTSNSITDSHVFPTPQQPIEDAVAARGYDARCPGQLGAQSDAAFHDPPLLFNLEVDPSENFPLDNTTQEYTLVREYIESKRAEHEAALAPAENQCARGGGAEHWLCCDPQSQEKYPSAPNCTCTPDNFEAFVCTGVPEKGWRAGGTGVAASLVRGGTSDAARRW